MALALYFVIAYIGLPAAWRLYVRRHPALTDLPGVTSTHDHHPGDPINLALIGREDDVKAVMHAAGWIAAEKLGLKSDLKIAAAAVLDRPYADAPVSNLYLWGRKEDLAFEQPVGNNPRERHHVRFWKAESVDDLGRPLWAGAATFDQRVGFSHTTGQITHHIAADVDAERDHVIETLNTTGRVTVESIDNFHEVREGYNGGGDRWFTDGKLPVATVTQQ
ncbi:MAG TPA: LssY C-terminal domain-containing protein [Pirellulaceae bacterium]